MRIAIAGGSAAGLSAALLLARAGHDVVVVDRDPLTPAPDVETAAAQSFRPTAPHLVQPHALLARTVQLLRTHFPDVYAAMVASGAPTSTLADQMPPTLTDRTSRPGDEQFSMLMTRRSTLDWVLLRTARAEARIDVRGGVRVTGLISEPTSPPTARGLRTSAGDVVADLTVDATGRRSPIDDWLRAAGARPATQAAAECGLAYYSQHFRLRPGAALPAAKTTRVLIAHPEFTAGIWGADNDTMVLALAPLGVDHRFRNVNDPQTFARVLRSVPAFAPWMDALEPISGVYAMGGLHNTLRRLVADGAPVITNLFGVGDTVCTTNPTLGRGLPLALQEAADLVQLVASNLNPIDAALEWDRRIEANVVPFYRDQALNDSVRLAQLRHTIFGDAMPEFAPRPDRVNFGQLRAAAMIDAESLRALYRLLGMLELPEAVYTDPAVVARVQEVAATPAAAPAPRPTRAELLTALGMQAAESVPL